MSDEARQCPVSPQELRFMADEIERRCDEALTQSAARGPCLICRKDAKRVRAVADWLEKPAPAASEHTCAAEGRITLERITQFKEWWLDDDTGLKPIDLTEWLDLLELAERGLKSASPPAQARPTREQGDAVDRRPLRVQYRELLERVIQSDPASDSTALRAEIGHALGHTFLTRTQASPPRTTRAQVLAAVNRYIVAIWSHETTEHEKAIDELMRDLGIEEVE